LYTNFPVGTLVYEDFWTIPRETAGEYQMRDIVLRIDGSRNVKELQFIRLFKGEHQLGWLEP
jgi:hypothetical protein